MKKFHIGFAVALCAGGLAVSAQAGTIGLQFDSAGKGQNVVINYTGNAPSGQFFQGSTTSHNVHAGVLNYNVMSVSGAAANYFSVGDSIQTFCADIFQSANQASGSNWKTVTFGSVENIPDPSSTQGPMGAERAGLLSALFRNHYHTATTGTNQQAAAFQLAVWELIHEEDADASAASFAASGFSVNDGVFFASNNSGARALATSWLSTAWSSWAEGLQGLSLMGAYGNGFQDCILIIPLPAPLLMAGLGLLAVPLLRRRSAA